MSGRDSFINDERRPRPVEPQTVTLELMLQAMLAIQRIETLEELRQTVEAEVTDSKTGDVRVRRIPLSVLARSMRRILLDPRRFVCALKKAAESPDWFDSNFIHFFNWEMSNKQIAAHLKLNTSSVRDYIQGVEIPTNCYDSLPPIGGETIIYKQPNPQLTN